MSDKDILKKIKKVQASLKTQRQPVFQVDQAIIKAKETTRFVKTVLAKENHILLSNEDQKGIIQALSNVNAISNELYQKCRTPQHFEMQTAYFMCLIQRIHDLSSCIRFNLEYCFYETETQGITIYKAIEKSWQRVKTIYQKITQHNQWNQGICHIPISAEKKEAVKKHYQRILPLAQSLLNHKKLSDITYSLSEEDIKNINWYFRGVKGILDLQEKATWNALKNIQSTKTSSGGQTAETVFNTLGHLEKKIYQYNAEGSLVGENVLTEEEYTQAISRLYEYYIPLETSRFMHERYQTLLQLKAEDPEHLENVLDKFFNNLDEEKKMLDVFMETLDDISQVLHKMNSILYNLSISFGKIYNLSTSTKVSPSFLERALNSVHGLLEKGFRIADSRKETTQHLHHLLHKAGLFQKSVEGGMSNALKLLEQAKEDLVNYDHKLKSHLKEITPTLNSVDAFKILRQTYEDRQELSTASTSLNSVISCFSPMLDALKILHKDYEQMETLRQNRKDAQQLYETTAQFLSKHKEYDNHLLDNTMLLAHDMEWFIENILLTNSRELHHYSSELEKALINAKARAHQKNITKPSAPTPEEKPVKKQAAQPTKKITSKTPIRKRRQMKKESSTTNPYDPFPTDIMENLKKACYLIDTEPSLGILDILKHPHVFFNYLRHLEAEYDPDHPVHEDSFLQEIGESQTAKDFVLNFLRMKFLPYGYLDIHGEKIPYDAEEGEFFDSIEKYIHMGTRSIETPKNVFRRLLLVMLGYEDAAVLNRALSPVILELLKDDHILPKEDQVKLRQEVPFIR